MFTQELTKIVRESWVNVSCIHHLLNFKSVAFKFKLNIVLLHTFYVKGEEGNTHRAAANILHL